MKTVEEIKQKRREHYKKNKEKINETRNIWREKNKEKQNKQRKEWYNKNKEKMKEWNKKNYMKNKEKINKHNLENYYEHREKYCMKNRETTKIRRENARLLGIKHYTNNKNCCELCGHSKIINLTFDHINGGGNKHRKEIKCAHIAEWVIKNNFPEGFRILCHNCQNEERIRKKQYKPYNKIFFS